LPRRKPTCFVSYSRESSEHEAWVVRLVRDLFANGVEVTVDLGLRPGASLTHYMEKAVRESDFVPIVCTPVYAHRANNRLGGVGYETAIVTGEIFASAPAHKFVPLLRRGAPSESLPTYLRDRLAIDFRADRQYRRALTELVRHLWNRPALPPFVMGEEPDFADENFRARQAASPPPRPATSRRRRVRVPAPPRHQPAPPRPDGQQAHRRSFGHSIDWARERYAEVVGENRTIFGAEHRVTFAARHDWAKRIGAAGNPAEAARLYGSLASDFAAVHGPDHHGVLAARRQQAWWTRMAGDYEEAARLYKKLNDYYVRRLGPGHRHSLAMKRGLREARSGGRDTGRALAA